MQSVIDQISDHPPKCYCCAAKASQQDTVTFIRHASKSFVAWMTRKLPNSWPIYTSTTAAQGRYTPSAAATPATSPAGAQYTTPATQLQSGGINSNIVQAQTQGTSPPASPVYTPAWVIFGIKDGFDYNEIENIGVSNLFMNDPAFFAELKRLENKYRWPLLKWVSPYIFTHCKFVQVRTMPRISLFTYLHTSR